MHDHYDDLERQLTKLEQLNCRMNIKAKEIILAQINSNSVPHILHTTHLGYGTVSYGDISVTSKLQDTLLKLITHNNMVTWIGEYSDPSIALHYTNLYLNLFKVARKESSFSSKICVTKWISFGTVTFRVMVQRK